MRYSFKLGHTLRKYCSFLCLTLLLSHKLSAADSQDKPQQLLEILCNIPQSELAEVLCISQAETKKPSPLLQLIRKQQKRNRKITAAILAFPFPFGIVGLHRIYLGCAPYVPVVYIATVGGGFGILPFIDFCMIILEKDIDRFINNQNVFMWVK